MILPIKLDLLIFKCIKELYSVCEQADKIHEDFNKLETWVDFVVFIDNTRQSIPCIKKDKYREITLKWVNSENLSLTQKQAFYNILNNYIVII